MVAPQRLTPPPPLLPAFLTTFAAVTAGPPPPATAAQTAARNIQEVVLGLPAAPTVARSGGLSQRLRPHRITPAVSRAAPLMRAAPLAPAPALFRIRTVETAPPAPALPWEQALVHDSSEMAILPGCPDELRDMLSELRGCLDSCFAASTNQTDKYHWRAWQKACAMLKTPCWRTDVAANTGVDPVGHRRELLLPALAVLIMYRDMQPRSKSSPAAHPRSAIAKLYGVAREHKRVGLKMAPFTLAVQVVKGMLHKYVEEHGADSLAPSRKNPLTHVLIVMMLGLADGATAAGFTHTVQHGTYLWTATKATFATLAETGMRKGDVSKPKESSKFEKGRLTFASLKWSVGGVRTAAPTEDQLHALRDGDGCWLVFGRLKNDPFSEFFGPKPAWLPYSGTAERCAARELAQLELAALAGGLRLHQRETTPLFGPALGAEWHHGLLDSLFQFALTACGVPEAERKGYSVHSFRIYLACALYAKGCPPERIMAILRWKSEEALMIYARMNDNERADWVASSMGAEVDSTVAAHLPRIDAYDWAASWQLAFSDGSLGKAAKAADRAIETGEDLLLVDGE